MATPKPLPDDQTVERFVRTHPDGGSPAEIAALMGCSRQRILQIQNTALAKLAVMLQYRLTLNDLIVDWQGQGSASDMESHGS